MVCNRCGSDSMSNIMSVFNTDMLCGVCKAAEMAHPRYAEAAEAELAAVRAGDYNFPGIGWPPPTE